MKLAQTIVSYQNIARPFPDRVALLAKSQEAARKAIPNRARADARMAEFTLGLEALRTAQGNYPRVMHTPRDMTAALLQTHLAAKAAEENKLESFILKGIARVLEFLDVRFSQEDWLGWMLSFFTWVEGLTPAPRPPADETAQPIPNNFNLALLGDWGTGLYGAVPCAQSIANDPDGYHMVLHMGDVYYSGLPEEVKERFLGFWPKPAGAIGRSLNGNHDMYTGGHGYFESMLPTLGQKTSYFALQNDYWTLVGLDTAYEERFGGQEGMLDDEQVSWLGRILRAAGDRKAVLFSHHQPFTLLDTNGGGNLLQALNEFLDAGKIFAWYWGHEHRCILYEPHPKFAFHGRCIG
ncbi:MAG TPA: metallophosphoesterase, partial [Bryobacteraceae bacterium]